jgi:hypothetical protein
MRADRKAYRRSAPMPAEKVAIPAPAKSKKAASNLPLGETYGNRTCMGWRHDEERYAVQVRDYRMARHLKRLKGAVRFAQGYEGGYLQTWLVPCTDEADGRELVDFLLKDSGGEADAAETAHSQQSKSEISSRKITLMAEMENPPSATTIAEDSGDRENDEPATAWDWTWREGWLDVLGVEFCEAFPRFDGQWAAQIRDPRLVPYFSRKRDAKVSGRAVADYGWLRQFMFPCENKRAARRIVRAALATLPEYEANKDKVEGGGK